MTGLSELPEEMNSMHRSMVRRAHPTCVVSPLRASDLWALRVKSLPGHLVVIIRHVGNRLNPSGEIAQFGAPGREFAESADAKARNCMRAGVGGTGSVPYNGGFDLFFLTP